MEKENRLFDKALSLLPKVKETFVCPSEDQKYSTPLKKGNHVEIDFGKHLVGRLKIKFGYKNTTLPFGGWYPLLRNNEFI